MSPSTSIIYNADFMTGYFIGLGCLANQLCWCTLHDRWWPCDLPECWLSKSHHCHQWLHVLSFLCNINGYIVYECRKRNNAEENEKISRNAFLGNERQYLHIYASDWHELFHHWMVCCDLKKEIDEQMISKLMIPHVFFLNCKKSCAFHI